MPSVDVVIVGGGIGGSALAASLASGGLEVELLERTTNFEDRVRGEWMAPWGVAEAKKLGLYDLLIEKGGHHLSRHVGYDELVRPEDAEANALPIGMLHPESPGPLCLEHVTMQQTLIENASRAGATVRRGVTGVAMTAGAQPTVRFEHEGERFEVDCRLVVGADGRASVVRRTLGIELHEAPVDHLIAGLLIEGADGWPDDTQAMGKSGDINYLIFPQGKGKVRLYADYDVAERGRFAGAEGAAKLLAAFDMKCVPRSQAIAAARPIGPCRSYPSQDAWTEQPYAQGGILIGDAAGYNDPILGQGLSITLRDARIVRDLLLGSTDWSESALTPYAEERSERLRRLRFVAECITQLFARFDAEAITRRTRAITRMRENPELFPAVAAAAYLGPDVCDPASFTPTFKARLFDA
jgi:2-polyprenyl-6-methoxyphenol hydroxylase-like FAD-dependent oxidoreductase